LELEDLGYIETNMNNMIPKKATFLVPPLPLVEEAKDKRRQRQQMSLSLF
jgi:hypothetical protein